MPQFGVVNFKEYEIFRRALTETIRLKRNGGVASMFKITSGLEHGIHLYDLELRERGTIGLVLALSPAGFPVVRSRPDTSVQNGANSIVRAGDVILKLNGKSTDGQTFPDIVDQIRQIRPVHFQIGRLTCPEMRVRFYGHIDAPDIIEQAQVSNKKKAKSKKAMIRGKSTMW